MALKNGTNDENFSCCDPDYRYPIPSRNSALQLLRVFVCIGNGSGEGRQRQVRQIYAVPKRGIQIECRGDIIRVDHRARAAVLVTLIIQQGRAPSPVSLRPPPLPLFYGLPSLLSFSDALLAPTPRMRS